MIFLFIALQGVSGFCTTGKLPDPRDRPEWRRKYVRALPFVEARATVRSIGFGSKEEWDEWVSEGKSAPWLGPYMPSRPELMYEEDWVSWDDWLGTPLPFEDARVAVHNLCIPNQEAWWRFVEERAKLLESLRVPARPHLYYRSEWRGYDDWLGLEETPLTFVPPRQ